MNLLARRRPAGLLLASVALVPCACKRSPEPLSGDLAASGPGEAPAPSAERDLTSVGAARVHPVGELGHGRHYEMSVDGIRDCPEGPVPPRRGFTRVGVEVDLQGTSPVEVPANVFYATATSDFTERFSATLSGCEPALPATRLTANVRAHGFVTFEVPKLARKIEVRYAPPVIGGSPDELRFEVTR